MDAVLPDFDATELSLGAADDGPLVATLVRQLCDTPTPRAVLYLHGFIDYFFQAHVAESLLAFGWDFYALDARRCGRSLRAGHRPNYCRSLDDYDTEIAEALRIIRDEDEHDIVVVFGHSTGGLIAATYAHRGAARAGVNGIVLNSPFFKFALPKLRQMQLPIAGALGALVPWASDTRGITPRYAESLRGESHGEWTYDVRWKPMNGFPVYFGWVRAIRAAQSRVADGLHLDLPVLMLHSTGSCEPGKVWDEAYARNDIVLNVRDMVAAVPTLGRDVTVRAIPGALHDVFLSAEAARDHALGATLAWLDQRFPRSHAS